MFRSLEAFQDTLRQKHSTSASGENAAKHQQSVILNVRSTFAGSLRWDLKAPGFEFSSVPATMIYCELHEMNLCHRKKDLKLDLSGKLRPQVGQLLTDLSLVEMSGNLKKTRDGFN